MMPFGSECCKGSKLHVDLFLESYTTRTTHNGILKNCTVANISDLRPILIIAYFEYFTPQVCNVIIKDIRSENRFSISFSIVFLWLIMSVSARHFLYAVSP